MTGATVPTIRHNQSWGDVANKRREISASLRARTDLTLVYNERLKAAAASRGCPCIDLAPLVIEESSGLVSDDYRSHDMTDHHLHAARSGRFWANALNSLADRVASMRA